MALAGATVRLVSSSTIRATVNSSGGVIQSGAPLTLSTTPVSQSTSINGLNDVVEGTLVDGSTLVYRSSDDKYVVQQLSLENVSGALDGGSF
jgi:hypothetical protein